MKTGKDWNYHSCISQEWWLQQMTVIVLLINYSTAQLQCFIGMMIPIIHCFHRTCLGPWNVKIKQSIFHLLKIGGKKQQLSCPTSLIQEILLRSLGKPIENCFGKWRDHLWKKRKTLQLYQWKNLCKTVLGKQCTALIFVIYDIGYLSKVILRFKLKNI